MKKVSAILLALALVLGSVIFVAAAAADVKADAQKVLEELAAVTDPEELKAALNDALAKAGIEKDADAASIPEGKNTEVADTIVAKLNLEGTDLADKIQGAMSNDFVSFLAGLYVPVDVTVAPPKTSTPDIKPPVDTGASPAIAIAAFATISVAAAAAFVCLKKKEA